MNVEILTDNFFLKVAMQNTLKKNFKMHCRCPAKFLIVDLTDVQTLSKTKKITELSLCTIIFLINKQSDSNLLMHLDYTCPVEFISLNSPVDCIMQRIDTVISSLLKKRRCNYSIDNQNETKWLSGKELIVIRSFFKGDDLSIVASNLKIDKRTALNYVGSSIKKLNVNLSVSNYLIFKLYEILFNSFPSKKERYNANDHATELCLLRKVYLKNITVYHINC